MRIPGKVMSIVLLAGGMLCTGAAMAQTAPSTAHADIVNDKGEKIGSATLRQSKSGVKINVEVSQLPPGVHAIHIHSAGQCQPPDFKSAGPHFNPDAKQHGMKNPAGSHAGDLPNFTVGSDGKAKISMLAKSVTLGDGPDSLFGPAGTSLVIHAGPDDYITDPAGDSGARIACGVIQK